MRIIVKIYDTDQALLQLLETQAALGYSIQETFAQALFLFVSLPTEVQEEKLKDFELVLLPGSGKIQKTTKITLKGKRENALFQNFKGTTGRLLKAILLEMIVLPIPQEEHEGKEEKAPLKEQEVPQEQGGEQGEEETKEGTSSLSSEEKSAEVAPEEGSADSAHAIDQDKGLGFIGLGGI